MQSRALDLIWLYKQSAQRLNLKSMCLPIISPFTEHRGEDIWKSCHHSTTWRRLLLAISKVVEASKLIICNYNYFYLYIGGCQYSIFKFSKGLSSTINDIQNLKKEEQWKIKQFLKSIFSLYIYIYIHILCTIIYIIVRSKNNVSNFLHLQHPTLFFWCKQ